VTANTWQTLFLATAWLTFTHSPPFWRSAAMRVAWNILPFRKPEYVIRFNTLTACAGKALTLAMPMVADMPELPQRGVARRRAVERIDILADDRRLTAAKKPARQELGTTYTVCRPKWR
jgi:hypothetical protein